MSGNIVVTNEQVTHNGQDWPMPWWSQNYDLASPYIAGRMDQDLTAGIYAVSTLGKSLACTNGFWTYDDAKGTGCDSCLAQLYSTKGSKCESCAGQEMDAGTVILIILAAIVILALLAVLSKVGFNWAAISISWNFLQVSSIFASFSIEWPQEVLDFLALFAFVQVDVDVVGAECIGRISYFEKWLMMVLAPFIMLFLFSSIAFVLQFASWVLSMTRYPIWAKRKLWRLLKPPVLIDQQLEDEDLTAKVARKLKNLKRKITYGFLTRFTKPIPASTLQALKDAILNLFVTFLSLYYQSGCKRALQVFSCLDQDPMLFDQRQGGIDGSGCPDYKQGESPVKLVFEKSILGASIGGSIVTCTTFNETTCKMEPEVREEFLPQTQMFFAAGNQYGVFGFLGLDRAPTHQNLMLLGAFFSVLYAVCIPVGFGLMLRSGRHQLNNLSFGRKFGYLYKRYETQYYAWECTVMVRKTILSAVDIFCVLPNGAVLPGQQAVAAMCVVIFFLLLQAAIQPYAEPHLDALETVLLMVNYIFLFLGVCGYAINMQSSTHPDRDMKVLLTVIMTLVLALGFLFMLLFLALDITLQLVRLYFRYIEGEGKYGARQQLVLTEIDKETRKLQALGGKLLAPERRTNFQKWLNAKATKDEKTLVKAAFTSLEFFRDAHEDHSMPPIVALLANIPLLGRLIVWIYQKQHNMRMKMRARRNEAARRRSERQQSRRASSSLAESSRASTEPSSRASGEPSGPMSRTRSLTRSLSQKIPGGAGRGAKPSASSEPPRETVAA
jgi:hypothetical protein